MTGCHKDTPRPASWFDFALDGLALRFVTSAVLFFALENIASTASILSSLVFLIRPLIFHPISDRISIAEQVQLHSG